MRQETTVEDVARYLDLFDELDLTVWIDGGWGVDALLGEQTRPHSDLDITIEQRGVRALREALTALGFSEVETNDRSDWNFVMANDSGKRVDFHVIVIDHAGRGMYGPPERGIFYPASSLAGRGTIGGRQVRCISAEFQVQCHSGYDLDAADILDVTALHRRFGIALTPEQRRSR